jgi:hypothetical protein
MDIVQAGKDPATGRFTNGNRFWEARSSHGRSPKFETSDDLEDAISQYFEWNESNPLYKDQLVTFQGAATHEPVAQMRAMTIGAMCMYIGVAHETWNEWKRSRPDFSAIMGWAESVIYRQKFEGASADLLNPNIIARDLGLTDKKDVTTDGKPLSSGIDLSKAPPDVLEWIVSQNDAAEKE